MTHRYRIKLRWDGFEPQMRYTTGEGKPFWTPLATTGYWAEPESYSRGVIKGKHPQSLRNALVAIQRAKRINDSGLLTLATTSPTQQP